MPRQPPNEPDLARVRALLARPGPTTMEPQRGWVPTLPSVPVEDLEDAWPSDEAAGLEHTAPSPPGRHRRPRSISARVMVLPAPLRSARLRASWKAVVAFTVALALAAAVFAARVAWAEQASAPRLVASTGGATTRGLPAAFATGSSTSASTALSKASSTAPATGPATAPSSSTTASAVLVDVVGQVVHPGIVSVTSGARVADALAAAGGALPGADLIRVNMARVVRDGEQVFVPRPGEGPPAALDPVGGTPGASAAVGSAGSTTAGQVVDLNTADVGQLDSLPGVGPVLAQRILEWRRQHGRFSTADELGEVSGIGDKLLEQIRPRVRV